MRMLFLQFQEVCKRKGIFRGSANVPFDEDGLEIKDFFSTPILYSLFASDEALDHGTHDLPSMTEQLSMT
ncbi:hypothetical protein FJTKL_02317 [Diaporthe vaccinii]|uniref:Uncharacterized protein n=1 Tax=Diaporthe vaccinii TaxID=105482 RepID=A0ABR4F3P1_9PEZI